MGAYRAMSYNTRAVDALYPVSFMLPPVSRFFLDENYREDQPLLEKLAAADVSREEVGIMHAANDYTERGGFSLYVPEYYDGTEPMPLVVAMHGGSGHGRSFLWTWLRDARTRGRGCPRRPVLQVHRRPNRVHLGSGARPNAADRHNRSCR